MRFHRIYCVIRIVYRARFHRIFRTLSVHRPFSARSTTSVTCLLLYSGPKVGVMGEAISKGWLTQGQEFEIASPRVSDIAQLRALAVSLVLPDEGWRSLITSEKVVCAKTQLLAGFYLADHYGLSCSGDRLRQLQAARNVLCNRFKLSADTVAFGADVITTPEWQGSELRSHLLRALLRNVGLRYKHLFRFCRKDDPSEVESLRIEGWRCFQEEDEICYFTLDVARALRELATSLVLRFPPGHVKLRVPIQAGGRIC